MKMYMFAVEVKAYSMISWNKNWGVVSDTIYHDGAVRSLCNPSSANSRVRSPWRHGWKLCIVGAQPAVKGSRSVWGFPECNCHILVYGLRVHSNDNFRAIHTDCVYYVRVPNCQHCSFENSFFTCVLAWSCLVCSRRLTSSHMRGGLLSDYITGPYLNCNNSFEQ